MLSFLFIFIFLYVLLVLREKLLKKYFHVEPRDVIDGYKHVNDLHKWLERGLFFLAAVWLFVIFFFPMRQELDIYLLIIFLIALFSIRSFMEWKYARGSKKHIEWISYIVIIVLLYFTSIFIK